MWTFHNVSDISGYTEVLSCKEIITDKMGTHWLWKFYNIGDIASHITVAQPDGSIDNENLTINLYNNLTHYLGISDGLNLSIPISTPF